MACEHKFRKYLNLEKLDFEPTTLIIGTFNPAWPTENKAEWFYGRTRNNYFWDVLPRIYNADLNLRKEGKLGEWKSFCRTHRIAITDLLESIEDADPNNEEHQMILKTYSDASIHDYFQNFTFTEILYLLKIHKSITNVYLTRSADDDTIFSQRWKAIKDYCGHNSKYHIVDLLTPSASARFQIKEYKKNHPGLKEPLRNFIFDNWKSKWHM